MDDRIWDPTTSNKNRGRLPRGESARRVPARALAEALALPSDHPGNPTVDVRGEARSHSTHASTGDPQARPYRMGLGREAKPCYMGHVLTEHRHGLVVDAQVTPGTGTAEREAALQMVARLPGRHRVAVGADEA